ncbi:hypothetical protein IFM89_005533 [Coptis chinensis]|uniref:Uncharacterized protein n=1 Tax=Coptis chinensis TaxID=261450 RepID=A0A835I5T5_9MAGN|nr:hypothetical protein IFM89_005533 [Coptis chinensis]
MLKMEEVHREHLCSILKFKPDLVIIEKGLSDPACHFLKQSRLVVKRTEELRESDIGSRAGLFEVRKIGDEFFAFIVECKDQKACNRSFKRG